MKDIQLDLDASEAHVLWDILMNIGGDPVRSPRAVAAGILSKIHEQFGEARPRKLPKEVGRDAIFYASTPAAEDLPEAHKQA